MIGKQAVRDTVKGKRADVLPLITTLKKLVNHPRLVYEVAAHYCSSCGAGGGQAMRSATNPAALGLDGCEQYFPEGFDRMVCATIGRCTAE